MVHFRFRALQLIVLIWRQSLTIGYLINLFVGRAANMGYPMTLITPDNMISILKVCLIQPITKACSGKAV